MASVVLTGDTSGTLTVSAPLVAGSNTQTLVATTGTLAPIVSGTAVSASGTSIDFTSIPSWVKRITVMMNGVSANGTSPFQIQIGAGSVETTGYSSGSSQSLSIVSPATSTSGFILVYGGVAANLLSGQFVLTLLGSNIWVQQGVGFYTDRNVTSGGNKTLSGTLDRVRITTVNGTDTFDAGSINILYE